MGRNAAFGRPGASNRLRGWWSTASHDVRANTVLGVIVAVVVAGLLFAAVTRSPSKPATGLAALAQLGSIPTSLFVPTTSTPPTSVAQPTSTSSPVAAVPTTPLTTTTTAPARSTGTPAATTTSVAPATPTTRANPDVIFSDPPPVTPTSQLTSPSSTAPPPASTTPTTAVRPATTTTTAAGALQPLPIDLPLLSTPS